MSEKVLPFKKLKNKMQAKYKKINMKKNLEKLVSQSHY